MVTLSPSTCTGYAQAACIHEANLLAGLSTDLDLFDVLAITREEEKILIFINSSQIDYNTY